MKNLSKAVLLSVAFLCLSSVAATSATLSVRSDSWPPYNAEPKSPKPGYMIQVLWEIFKPQGYVVDYDILSWAESLDAVREGKFNAVVGAAKDDAPDFIFPQETFGLSDTAFFVKKGSAWRYDGPSSYKKVKIGVIESYSYNEEVDAYLESSSGDNVFVATGDNPLLQLIQMLRSGEIDVVVEDSNVMFDALVDNNIALGEITPAGRGDEISDLYVAFSPADPESKKLADIFDAGIKEMRQKGKLQAILKLYGLKDWATPTERP